jgi:hypothetical protein
MAAPLKRRWKRQAIGWLAVEKMPISTFDSSEVFMGEVKDELVVMRVAEEVYCMDLLFLSVLASPKFMLKSKPSS